MYAGRMLDTDDANFQAIEDLGLSDMNVGNGNCAGSASLAWLKATGASSLEWIQALSRTATRTRAIGTHQAHCVIPEQASKGYRRYADDLISTFEASGRGNG
jgi:hypothetical protein